MLENKSHHEIVQDTVSHPRPIPDEYFAFSVCFFILSYKVLFWSDRIVSIGVLLLTSCCALSMTQIMFPHTHRVFMNAFSDQIHSLPSQDSTFFPTWSSLWSHFQSVPAKTFRFFRE